MSTVIDASTEIPSIEDRIQTLTDLYNRLQGLRQIPTLLLKPPSGIELPAPLSNIRPEFQNLKEIGDLVQSEKIQEALRAARESEKKDKSELTPVFRRENRKRRRPPSPESPQPYVSFQPKTSSLFPVNVDEAPLRADVLPDYIREFNRTNQSKLHIWSYGKPSKKISNPVVIRFSIPDVLTTFITLGYNKRNPILAAETVTALGPREQKSPHGQSDYISYQCLSQQIAKMIQSHPRVSFQSLMRLLCSYSGIFVDKCTKCQRVLSLEGHVPPVSRIWIDSGTGNEGEKGQWEPRHITCLNS